MPTLTAIVEHNETTTRSGFRYQFTPKHHGSNAGAAQWLPSLMLEEEFAVFNFADQHEVVDEAGNFYGVLSDGQEGIRYLGTWYQQMAEFPVSAPDELWHGYLVAIEGCGTAESAWREAQARQSCFRQNG